MSLFVTAVRNPFGERKWLFYRRGIPESPVALLSDIEMHTLLSEIKAQFAATGEKVSNRVGSWVRDADVTKPD
jgi:hypothetical protein